MTSPVANVACQQSRLDFEGGERLFDAICHACRAEIRTIRVDLSAVEFVDSQGGAWMRRAFREAAKRGVEIDYVEARGNAALFLDLIRPGFSLPPPVEAPRAGFFEAIGDVAYEIADELRDAALLIGEVVYWVFWAPLRGRPLRRDAIIEELYQIGAQSVGLTLLINALMGLIITILSSVQAEQYGAELYVADAIVLGFSRELGVIMTSVVLAARSGAYIAAELATMTVQEEVDSLRSMGHHPVQYLVAPKIVAVLIVMPLLTAMSIAAGIFGGTVFATLGMGIPLNQWHDQTIEAFRAWDLMQGFVKSFVFGTIIVLVGCNNGLRVTGGARGVGVATTRSVVQDVVLIVIADMIFAVAFMIFA
jgi:phospholipid/cholesterol/gamma-HCH transport system permease protein